MGMGTIPATVVIVASRPQRSGRDDRSRGGGPVSWVTCTSEPDPVADVLELPVSALASRQAVRDLVREARRVLPSLCAVRVRGAALRQHAVLAEVGIRVAVVDVFSDEGKGTRRPAPRGWACRSVVWGLWEVQVTPVTRGWRRVVRGTTLPPPRSGGLVVAHADDGGHPLDACLAWAARAHARGIATLATVSALPARLEQGGWGDASASRTGSVLQAA